MKKEELASYIDHVCLKAYANRSDMKKLCAEAVKYGFRMAAINSSQTAFVSGLLKGTGVHTGAAVGFPLGQTTIAVKVFETKDAIENGADEIDMVINIAALKNKDYKYIKEEIEEIRDAIDGKVLKVIIETCLLTKEEIIKMTEICNETFVNFIKTSTGFSQYGARVQDIELINMHKSELLEIKASGGIRDIHTAEAMISAGATRLGTSSGVKLIECACGDCDCDNHMCHCKEEK